MKRLVVVLACFAFPIASRAIAAPPIFSADLSGNSVWDDGQEEYSVYDALEPGEGTVRVARVVIIVGRDRGHPADVIRMNQVIDIPMGVYAVHEMISTSWDRHAGNLTQVSFSENDSSDNTFRVGWLEGSNFRLTFHACCGPEGSGVLERRLPGGAVFFDELPWKLRTLARPESPGSYDIDLVPSIAGSWTGKLDPERAKIVVAPPTRDKLRIDVVRGAGADRFVFDRNFPHLLRLWLRPDGSRRTLRKTRRFDHRKHNQAEDEKLLE